MTGDDEPVAAVIAGAAEHRDRARAEPVHDGLGGAAARLLHQIGPGRAPFHGHRLGGGHLLDREQLPTGICRSPRCRRPGRRGEEILGTERQAFGLGGGQHIALAGGGDDAALHPALNRGRRNPAAGGAGQNPRHGANPAEALDDFGNRIHTGPVVRVARAGVKAGPRPAGPATEKA